MPARRQIPFSSLRPCLALVLAVLPSVATAGGFSAHAPPTDSAQRNAIGGGPSVGVFLGKNATLWGYALDYGRHLKGRWGLSFALAFDEETEKRPGRSDKVVRTYNLITAGTYGLTDRLGLAFGFGFGLFDDDNPQREFRSSNNLGTGVALSWTFLKRGPHTLGASPTLEYDFGDRDFSFSLDLTYAFLF